MLANITRKLMTAWSIRNVPPRVSPPQPVDPENKINTEPAREQVRFSGQNKPKQAYTDKTANYKIRHHQILTSMPEIR